MYNLKNSFTQCIPCRPPLRILTSLISAALTEPRELPAHIVACAMMPAVNTHNLQSLFHRSKEIRERCTCNHTAIMKQADISIPKVVSGPSLPLLAGVKLHTLAFILRTCVWCISGDGSKFDRVIYVSTPGLGTGRVRCAVCLPEDPHRRVGSLPLLLCFEGGGFILGQPEDGQEHCRRLADEVCHLRYD
jgi:hypothetical protein